MNSRKVYIIILNWNGADDTIECLKSLNKIVNVEYQIILVDNKSSDISYGRLEKWCYENFMSVCIYSQSESEKGGLPEIEEKLSNEVSSKKILIIKNEQNLGFAAGNNVALKYVLSKQEESNYSLLLNNDTVSESNFLEKLTSFMNNHSEYVACTPQIRLYEPKNKIWNCGGKITWHGNRRYYYYNKKVSETPQAGFKYISFITGCALFFKPEKTGLLSEKFFFGEEDYEFSLRIKKNKQKMACVFDSVIYHKVGASINIANTQKEKMCLHYTMRLINLKSYQNKFRWTISFLLYLFYSFVLIVLKKRMGIKFYFLNWKNVLRFIGNNNSIRYSEFKEIYGIYS